MNLSTDSCRFAGLESVRALGSGASSWLRPQAFEPRAVSLPAHPIGPALNGRPTLLEPKRSNRLFPDPRSTGCLCRLVGIHSQGLPRSQTREISITEAVDGAMPTNWFSEAGNYADRTCAR